MAATVQVVLKQDVDNLGAIGEVVRVRRGYARNYLLPRGAAVIATRGNVRQLEHERALAEQKAAKLRAQYEKMAAELAGLVVMMPVEAGDDGKLFGSVTAQDVVDALHSRNIEVERKKLIMPPDLIKMVGDYEDGVQMPYGVTGTFKLTVKTKA